MNLAITNRQIDNDRVALEARRAYYREWRAKNKDKVREYNANYWARKAKKDALISDMRAKNGETITE